MWHHNKPSSVLRGKTSDGFVTSDSGFEERVGSHIEPQPDGCWLWRSVAGKGRYGTVNTPWGTYEQAHRVVYSILVDDDIAGYHLHHECRNKACVNPAHLTKLTASEHTKLHADERAAS